MDETPDFVTYLHRIGRTGRFGRSGVSVAFVHDKRSWMDLQAIQRHYGVPIHLIPGGKVDLIEKLLHLISKNNADIAKKFGAMENSRHAPENIKTGFFDTEITEANLFDKH
jgi:ATP-dependent RNA helicase DDX19/DBP5